MPHKSFVVWAIIQKPNQPDWVKDLIILGHSEKDDYDSLMAVQLYKGGNLIISYAMVSDQLISSSEKVSSWIFLKNK